jgi:glucoamylase
MVDSLKVVDAVLKRGLPQGPGWLRYNWDGYGQRPDGGPYQGWGQGRVWPLLTGERAHYELAAGNDISELIKTYESFATKAGSDAAGAGLGRGCPTRDARLGDQPPGRRCRWCGLMQSTVKLLRSAVDGKVFDRIDAVYRAVLRACRDARKLRGDLEIIL